MTPLVWMFIRNYDLLRKFIIENKFISSLIQLEYSAFSEATVPICTFVLSNISQDYNGIFIKLSEFKGGMEVQNEKVLNAINSDSVDYKFISNNSSFRSIPGMPISYWTSEAIINAFKSNVSLDKFADVNIGLSTGNNNKFLRYWYEVNYNKIGFEFDSSDKAKHSNLKWFPHNKGGSYRKWYGNQDYIINWENDGEELRNFKGSVIRNPKN